MYVHPPVTGGVVGTSVWWNAAQPCVRRVPHTNWGRCVQSCGVSGTVHHQRRKRLFVVVGGNAVAGGYNRGSPLGSFSR